MSLFSKQIETKVDHLAVLTKALGDDAGVPIAQIST